MGTLIQLSNVSFYPDEEFGLRRLSLELLWGKRYLLRMNHSEQLSAVLGVIEGRYKPDSGTVYKSSDFVCQSDRLLLEDRVYRKKLGAYLALAAQPFMFFGGRRRSKQTLMESMKAWHLRHFQIYRLRGEEKTMFALLALGFQETGLLIISRLQLRSMSEPMVAFLHAMIKNSPCAILLATLEDEIQEPVEAWLGLGDFVTIDLREKIDSQEAPLSQPPQVTKTDQKDAVSDLSASNDDDIKAES